MPHETQRFEYESKILTEERKRTFIDVFAGCGGLSLGLMRAGWQGAFAIEKDKFAFETLKANLIDHVSNDTFNWPNWLPVQPYCALTLLDKYSAQLEALEGGIDLMAGGPPCQGFSSAGRREASDPRNALMRSYLKLVSKIKPKAVLIENVHGITVDFMTGKNGRKRVNYAEQLIDELSIEYQAHWNMINVSEFGVPQARTRFFLLAIRRDVAQSSEANPFEILEQSRKKFLRDKGIMAGTSATAAISDLEVTRNGVVDSKDSAGFSAIAYVKPRTNFQKLMHEGLNSQPSNTRLARHRPDITARFAKIIEACHEEGRLNVSISREMREAFGLKKMALRVLDPDRPSPTITSMPDDLLHYKEPRTLTVRENARLQSFPDWFDFKGKYTTGGLLRKREVPRFTQVANAVPPLIAEALGLAIEEWIAKHESISHSVTPA